jgi:phosphoenolpyruvate carboxylase
MEMNLSTRLKELHKLTIQTPLFNPVSQLGLELSRELENGQKSLSDIANLVSQLECDAIQSRATHLHDLVAPVDVYENLEAFRKLVLKTAREHDFSKFQQIWSKPLIHSVFTAHPTFLLNRNETQNVANAASSGEVTPAICELKTQNDVITLDYEHKDAMLAIQNAAIARDQLSDIIINIAQKHYPEEWHKILPKPFKFATWVGYDMDGRTDITWATSLRYRLSEKVQKLENYSLMAQNIGLFDLNEKLQSAMQFTQECAKKLLVETDDPIKLSEIANFITQDNENKILSLKPIIAQLREIAKEKNAASAREILVLASSMETDGLGMGEIHFRLNSMQLNNAIRSQLIEEDEFELVSATAIKRLQKLIKEVKPLRSNFAALAIETTTALRQYLAMVQILRHIDNDAAIRLLIAECEQPQTVLIALYFAKLFGIDEQIDISPLFETETAMEHGARFLDSLMADVNYRKYVRKRGRLSIQTGFSDAGRFVGQIPAALAIERLHGRLARIMAKHDLDDVSALIFNTHGESMGRGAHPYSIEDRLTYPMSKWARNQFKSRDINLELEVSFQGGDGYLFFRSDALALATLTRIAEVQSAPVENDNDPFYTRTDLSLDFYRGIRRVQREYLNNSAYSRAISAFGLGLLKETGSRKSRRQSDIAADRDMSLRQIRAIPHNAILQQLGYPVNVLAGSGTAAKDNIEAVSELLKNSARGRQLIRLLNASNARASIKTLAAYGDLFNCAYWASRPYRGTEGHLENACLALAEKLEYDDRPGEIRRLASSLRVDGLRFHRLISQMGQNDKNPKDEERRRSLGVLHALRLSLMQHIFLRAVQIPAFSRRNDISRDDILEMIFSLRIDDALSLLRRAFPVIAPSLSDFNVNEPTDYPKQDSQAYKRLHEEYFDAIDNAYSLVLRIGVSIANYFGAHG